MKQIDRFNLEELNIILVLDKLRASSDYQDMVDIDEDNTDCQNLEDELYSWQERLQDEYFTKSKSCNLTSFNNKDVGIFTKFSKLYEKYSSGKELHEFRTKLIALAEGRCPICGASFGYSQVTLDHVLPKSKYPSLAILPVNLVPICLYCNMRKNSKIKGRIFHPYFEGYNLAAILEIPHIRIDHENIEHSKINIDFRNFEDVQEHYQNKDDYEKICININDYGLRERFSGIAQIIFHTFLKDFLKILSLKNKLFTKDNVKNYLNSVDNVFINAEVFDVDERFFKHLCIEAIIKNDDFLTSILNRVNKIQEESLDLKLKYVIHQLQEYLNDNEGRIDSNSLALIKSNIEYCEFVGVYRECSSGYKLCSFQGDFQEDILFIDDLDLPSQFICKLDGDLLRKIKSKKELGTEVVIKIDSGFILLAFEGSLNFNENDLKDLSKLIREKF